MPLNILFAARPERWVTYETPLRQALDAAGIAAHLSTDIAPQDVDYIVYAPNSPLQDFTPYTRAKAVLNLWAGVENITNNQTLKIPLARMVDPGLTKGMVEWVTGHVMRYHLGLDTDIRKTDTDWTPRTPPLAQERQVTILGLGALGAAVAETLVYLGFNVTGWSRSPKDIAGVTCLHGDAGRADALHRAEIAVLLLPNTPDTENTLNAETLAQMPAGACIINPGRGALIDDDALLESAIRGMLSGLDPHSAYLDAQEFKDITVSTSGKFGGLGIEVQGQNGFVRVIAPIDDTPAQRAGVEAGDLIIKVNDKAVKGLTLTESVRLMRGEPGTKVTLDVVREGEAQPLQIDIVRDIIEVRSVRSRMLEPNYGYLRISTFTGGTGRLLEEELQKLRARNDGALRGLVLDLRTNPGGVLNAAVDVSDAFLNRGEIVSIKGRSNQANRTFNATPGDLLDGVPLVVLINEASASASEIVAGALQDHSRAVLVGAKTFGKGSVQTIVPLKNDAAIKLTTARYYTPSGRSIQAEGIDPDIAIERVKVEKRDGPKAITEADLAGRLDNDQLDDLLEAEDDAELKSDPNLAENDFGLFEALNILKGLSILEQARR